MWATNWLLMFWFFFNQPIYKAFVANGAPCMYNQVINGRLAGTPQPVCWYDPSNTNPFIPYTDAQ